jgi:hypothetical protein
VITEHSVDLDWLAGNPRWWTITNPQGSREVVRAVFTKGQHYPGTDPDAPDEMVIYAILKPGQYQYPPLVVATLKMGTDGWDDIAKNGGAVVLYDSDYGRKLELMLVGWKG